MAGCNRMTMTASVLLIRPQRGPNTESSASRASHMPLTSDAITAFGMRLDGVGTVKWPVISPRCEMLFSHRGGKNKCLTAPFERPIVAAEIPSTLLATPLPRIVTAPEATPSMLGLPVLETEMAIENTTMIRAKAAANAIAPAVARRG